MTTPSPSPLANMQQQCVACESADAEFRDPSAHELALCGSCFEHAGQNADHPLSFAAFPADTLMGLFIKFHDDLPTLQKLAFGRPFFSNLILATQEFWSLLNERSFTVEESQAYKSGNIMRALSLVWNRGLDVVVLSGGARHFRLNAPGITEDQRKDSMILAMLVWFLERCHLSAAIFAAVAYRDAGRSDPIKQQRQLTLASMLGLDHIARLFQNDPFTYEPAVCKQTVTWIIEGAQQTTYAGFDVVGVSEFHLYFDAIVRMLSYSDDIATNVILLNRLLVGLNNPEFQLSMGYSELLEANEIADTNMTRVLLYALSDNKTNYPKNFHKTTLTLLRVLPIPRHAVAANRFSSVLQAIFSSQARSSVRLLLILLEDERITTEHVQDLEVDATRYPILAELVQKVRLRPLVE